MHSQSAKWNVPLFHEAVCNNRDYVGLAIKMAKRSCCAGKGNERFRTIRGFDEAEFKSASELFWKFEQLKMIISYKSLGHFCWSSFIRSTFNMYDSLIII